jgi:hypothetical protein
MVSCDSLPFVNFVSCSENFSSFRVPKAVGKASVQKSSLRSLPSTGVREIWCQSSIKFDRLRQFLVIHRLLAIFSPFFGVFEFDRVRRSSNFSAPFERVPPHPAQPQDKPRTASACQASQVDAGAIRLKFIPRCQRSIVVVRFWFRKSCRFTNRRMGFSPLPTTVCAGKSSARAK